MRRGFEYAARAYEARNPGVRIEYLDVPKATFLTWLTTQFTGGMAPDLVEVVSEMPNEAVAKYFLPLGAFVGEANPYNLGTSLEGRPWRDTFVDGLATAPGYRDALLENFGIPTNLVTSRYYYNKRLYHAATGRTKAPQDYDELLQVCREIDAWAAHNRRKITPLGGSREVYILLSARVFGQQTQRLALEWGDPLGMLRCSTLDMHLQIANSPDVLQAKPLLDSFTILHQLGRFMPPGFLGATRADAVFHFQQERCVIMMERSSFYHTAQEQSGFEIGAFALPLPGPQHPRFGGNALGELTEIEQNAGAALGVTRFARDTKLAIDFLRFLASAPVNREFSRLSQMLPVIVGVEVADEIAAFLPRESGFPSGFTLISGSVYDRREQVVFSQLHHLFGPSGSPQAFVAAAGADYNVAARDDFAGSIRNAHRAFARQDTLHAALDRLGAEGPDADSARRKQQELEERGTVDEFVTMWTALNLKPRD